MYSLANYCNFALARTTCRVVMKLDGKPDSRYHKQREAYRRGRRPIDFDEKESRPPSMG